jgi:hypothetical protein
MDTKRTALVVVLIVSILLNASLIVFSYIQKVSSDSNRILSQELQLKLVQAEKLAREQQKMASETMRMAEQERKRCEDQLSQLKGRK